MQVSDVRYARAQEVELEWWQNNHYDPYVEWRFYDKVFLSHYPDRIATLAVDVGSGPVPFLNNHNVSYNAGIAVDPLIFEYEKILKYDLYNVRSFRRHTDIRTLVEDCASVVFCLNTLDHCQDPAALIAEMSRILVRDGKIFIYLDIDKPPDPAHPLQITRDWLAHELLAEFEPELWLEKKSFKFQNQVLYFVGRKR